MINKMWSSTLHIVECLNHESNIRDVSTTTDTNRTYVSAFKYLVLHANTSHTGGSFYTSNQQSSCVVKPAGEIFRVPLSTMHLPPTEGGAKIVDVQAKCHVLFLSRCWKQLQTEDTLTARWFKLWKVHFYND